LLCLCYWLRTGYGVVRLYSLPKLSDVNSSNLKHWPKLSVVIPACNEADKIESAVCSVLADGYPDLEVVLVDDRSTDATGQCIDRLATAEDRIVPIHITELPDGWLGKVNALNRGQSESHGDFVLFTDADVHFMPGTLQKAVGFCIEQKIDHLVACPTIWPSKLIVDSMIIAFLRQFCTILLPPWRVNNKSPRAFFGVGAFNLVRRSKFYQTQGFEWLRLETGDDVGLGLLMKRAGANSMVVTAFDRVGLHWYRTIGEMMRGAEKGFASAGRCSFLLMVFMGLMGMLIEISPLVGFLFCISSLRPVGVILSIFVFVCFIFCTITFACWGMTRILPGLITPITAPLSAVLAFRAGWLGWRRGGIMWRGTLYPSNLLRSNSRNYIGI
jgi:glycosyltransferase involved in cell wall biosynthesis